MSTRSKKIQDILFGKSTLEGGLPVRARLDYPEIDGFFKTIFWEGNSGLLIHLIKRIEKLEHTVQDLSSKKK